MVQILKSFCLISIIFYFQYISSRCKLHQRGSSDI